MTASKYVKSVGLKSVREMAEISTVPENLLYRWWNSNNERFKCVAHGCVSLKNDDKTNGIIDVKEALIEIKKLIKEMQK